MYKKSNLTDFEKAMLQIEIWKMKNTIETIEEQYCGSDFKEKKKKIKTIEEMVEKLEKYL